MLTERLGCLSYKSKKHTGKGAFLTVYHFVSVVLHFTLKVNVIVTFSHST
jgi:hypothetical protein